MSAATSTSQPNKISDRTHAARTRRDKAVSAVVFAFALLACLLWTDGEDGLAASIKVAIPPDVDTDAVVLSLASLGYPAKTGVESSAETPIEARDDTEAPAEAVAPARGEVAEPIDTRAVNEPSPLSKTLTPGPLTLRSGDNVGLAMTKRLSRAGRHAVHAGAYRHRKLPPKFHAAYRSVVRLVALRDLPRIAEDAAQAGSAVVGVASTYNPYRDGKNEGDAQTASGEIYDPEAWTAAIQIGLRAQFGGVRYGRNYQPAYALVACDDRQVIVKINDVGPLRPGRVIDLNERAMRYFDPFMRLGLLQDVRVTLLPGEDWTPGPIGGVQIIRYAGVQ